MIHSARDVFAALVEGADAEPMAIAVASPARTLRRGEFVANVNSAAAFALANGIKPGDLVVVRTPDPDAHMQLVLGLMKVGCRVCARRSTDLLEAHGVVTDVLITDDAKAVREASGNAERTAPPPRRIIALDDGWRRFDRMSAASIPAADNHSIIFTSSGTTGLRKLIEIEGATFAAWTVGAHPGHAGPVRFLVTANPTTLSAIRGTVAAIGRGGSAFRSVNLTAQSLLDAIAIYQPTAAAMTPLAIVDMLKLLDTFPRRVAPMKLLRVIGAYCPPETLEAAKQRLADEIVMSYGSTEVWNVALRRYESGQPNDLVGRMQPEFEVATANEAGDLLPVGEQGILRFRNSKVPSGRYLGDANAASYRDGWFIPGDIGYVDGERNLYLTGRADAVINIGGDKINAEVLEAAGRQFPRVADFAVAGILDADGITRLHAAVVSDRPVSLERLNRHLAQQNPHFVLASLTAVSAIPRPASGKVDRPALKRMLRGTATS